MNAPKSGSPRRRVNRGQSIIGFTEAELGLFLALLFFGLNQLGKTGAPPTAQRARPAVDTTARVNPRLQQLMTLARKLDSLDRAMRSAFARDSALASRLARLQRERDSLSALNRPPIQPGGGAGALAVAGRAAAAPNAVAARLTAVERELALAQLTRTGTASALAAANLRADSARRELDAVAPSVAAVIAPVRVATDSTRAAKTTEVRVAAATIPPSAVPRDTMAVLRALASASVPPSANAAAIALLAGQTGSPGVPGSGIGNGTGMGTGMASARNSRVIGTGIGNGSGTGEGGVGPGRSRQTPTCIELKVDTGSVAEVLIVGADRYTVRGTTGTLDTLLKTMQAEIASSRKNTCRHNVRIRTAPQLAVDDYILALNALLPYFNTELARAAGAR